MESARKHSGPVRRILAIKLGHIGDTLLMTPALDALRRLFPDAGISVMVRDGTQGVLNDHPFIDDIIIGAGIGKKQSFWQRLPQEWNLIRQLRRKKYDLVVDFSGGDRGVICGWLSGARERVGYSAEGKGLWGKERLYSHVCRRPWKNVHTVLKDTALVCDYAQSIGREGFDDPDKVAGPLVMRVSEADAAWARKMWEQSAVNDGLRVLVHPTSRWLFKCWNTEKVVTIMERLHAQRGVLLIMTGGSGERELQRGREIESLCQFPIQAQLGSLTLGQLAALIREADLFVGIDSAPMHIAAAVGTPVVAIFGPSLDALWSPWRVPHRVVRRPCPCMQVNKITCDKSRTVSCLDALTVDEVWSATEDLLKETAASRAKSKSIS